MIDTSDSRPDLGAVNGNLNELAIAEANQRKFNCIILRLKSLSCSVANSLVDIWKGAF